MNDFEFERRFEQAFPTRSGKWHQLDKDRKTIEEMIHDREIVFFPLAESIKGKSGQLIMDEQNEREKLMENKPILQKEIESLKERVREIEILMSKEVS